ncbi:DHH family phosphoesterase [Exiguobacterium sp. SH5S4]|uniref:DHH family phosphoesterase n=1 Tax=Exiguobacterium sp. SH5S4 TaxID=2510961 RepID=UPI0013756D67|nr:DHH family phosphoesterase [Exiguobacterium sp. SH5S4]
MLKWAVSSKQKINYGERCRLKTELAKKILEKRGVDESFFVYDESDILDPYSLLNIKKVCKRILDAIKKGENIGISADIDPDGVTSAVSMRKILIRHGHPPNKIRILTHDRSLGHGVKHQMESAFDFSELLIIVDSSSNDEFECEELADWMDVIILDHHEIENNNEFATIVNPMQRKCGYTNKRVSAATIVYHVAQVLDDMQETYFADEIIDMVALGMVADVVSVKKKSNRALIYKGLNNITNIGLEALVKLKNQFTEQLKTSDFAFNVIPTVNSALRFNDQDLVYELFTTEDEYEAKKIAKELNDRKEARRAEVQAFVESTSIIVNSNVVVGYLENNNGNSSMNGLVAQKLASEYSKPAMILNPSHIEGKLGGSLRAPGDFDLRSYLADSGLFDYVLGHASAAGFRMNSELVDDLRDYIETNEIEFEVREAYDVEVETLVSAELTDIEEINRITGAGFDSVTVKYTGYVDKAETIGKTGDHLAFMVDDIKVMKFYVKDDDPIRSIKKGDTISVLGIPSINSWYNFQKREKVYTNQILAEKVVKV